MEVTGKITAIAFGGNGILRHEGLVIFVPFTALQDEIVCEVTKKKQSFAEGKLLKILKPGPDRIPPGCPYYERCGGCQIQHLNYQAQLNYKQSTVKDALHRIGKLSSVLVQTIAPATEIWAYRQHITLSLQAAAKGFQAGYIEVDQISILPIAYCPIFTDPSDPIIERVRKIAFELDHANNQDGRVTIMKGNLGKYIIAFQFENLPSNAEQCFSVLPEEIEGISVIAKNKTFHFGNPFATMKVAGLQIKYSPLSFLQNHPEQRLNLYKHLEKIASKIQPKTILDLYCGIGITSLLLSSTCSSVVGVEVNPQAIKLAKENARKNRKENVKFIESPVEKISLKEHVDFLIVNPPRIGLDSVVIKNILKMTPEHIVYISCMPPTLARDLKKLCEKYEIVSCQPFDMFPQTAHVETLVHLRLQR